jgi:hypothetical protein
MLTEEECTIANVLKSARDDNLAGIRDPLAIGWINNSHNYAVIKFCHHLGIDRRTAPDVYEFFDACGFTRYRK